MNADAFKLDPRIAFAAERTLLSWVRTGLGMMGFGFAVARLGDEIVGGVALVALGVITNVVGAIQHERNMKRLRAGSELEASSSRTATALALALAIVGMGMAGYLALS